MTTFTIRDNKNSTWIIERYIDGVKDIDSGNLEFDELCRACRHILNVRIGTLADLHHLPLTHKNVTIS